MKMKLFFIVSCLCVHFFISSEEAVTDVEKSESETLQRLMHDALTAEAGRHQTANEAFRQKYGQRQIEISYVSKDNAPILISNEKISIDFSFAQQFLTAFSESIKNLSIAYHLMPEGNHKEIGRMVNVHCSETLEEFQAKMCKNGAFADMQIPFKQVKKVVFDGDWLEHADNQLGLDQLFPEIRVLNLTYSGGYIYDRYYKNLVELNVFGSTAYDLGKLIEKNPQIKQLRVEETTMGFLKFVNEKLPDLITLAFNVPIDLANYQEPTIQFEHVNKLSITDSHQHIRTGKFLFKNLKHFELPVDGNIEDEWISFFESNKDLESLTITTGYFNDATMQTMSKKFTGLLEANINCDSTVSVERVADFMENNKQMTKITLNLKNGSTAYFTDLAKRLEKQWKITPIEGDFSILSAIKFEPYVVLPEETHIDETNVETGKPPQVVEVKPNDGSTQSAGGDQSASGGQNVGGNQETGGSTGCDLAKASILAVSAMTAITLFN